MTQTNPPIGYEMGYGTWGTDADHTTSIYKTGDSCVLFEDTTPASSPHLDQKVSTPCTAGDLFRVSCWVRADSNTAGNTVSMGLLWFDNSDSYLSVSFAFSAEVTTVNTWEFKTGVVTAPASTGGCRAIMLKNNTAFHAAFDSIFVEKAYPCFFAYRDNDYFEPGNVSFDTGGSVEYYDIGSCFNMSTGVFTAPVGGIYSFTAFAYTEIGDTSEVYTLYLESSAAPGDGYLSASDLISDAGSPCHFVTVSCGGVVMAQGDTAYIRFIWSGSDTDKETVGFTFYGIKIQ